MRDRGAYNQSGYSAADLATGIKIGQIRDRCKGCGETLEIKKRWCNTCRVDRSIRQQNARIERDRVKQDTYRRIRHSNCEIILAALEGGSDEQRTQAATLVRDAMTLKNGATR